MNALHDLDLRDAVPVNLDDDRLRTILRQALPLWREGTDTHTIAWFLTIDGVGIIHESQVATALARHRDGLLTLDAEACHAA